MKAQKRDELPQDKNKVPEPDFKIEWDEYERNAGFVKLRIAQNCDLPELKIEVDEDGNAPIGSITWLTYREHPGAIGSSAPVMMNQNHQSFRKDLDDNIQNLKAFIKRKDSKREFKKDLF